MANNRSFREGLQQSAETATDEARGSSPFKDAADALRRNAASYDRSERPQGGTESEMAYIADRIVHGVMKAAADVIEAFGAKS